MTDSATGSRAPDVAPAGSPGGRRLAPLELAVWVEQQAERISDRWYADVGGRGSGWDPSVAELVREFVHLMVGLIPGCLGPYRSQVDPIWRQAAELYGQVGAMRGLAAGEIIEEVQLLREALIRFLYAEPPRDATLDDARLSLREMLRLSRIVDRGVTHASVGHTDALFFALFHGNGIAQTLTGELVEEVRAQLAQLRTEKDEIMRLLRN